MSRDKKKLKNKLNDSRRALCEIRPPGKILVIYFVRQSNSKSYVPLDIGYALSYLSKEGFQSKIKATSLLLKNETPKDIDWKEYAEKIHKIDFDTVIFFIDNILWSGDFYEGTALQLAARLKKINPALQIGLQSYKIRDQRSIKTLGENLQLDFILRGEPERSLRDMLAGNAPEKIPGLTYRGKSDILLSKELTPLSDLSILPSPYLTGLFDELIEHFSSDKLFLIASRGCPYRCHYCFRSVKFDTIRTFPASRVVEEIKYLQDRGIKKIFFLDDTFAPTSKYLDELVFSYAKIFPDTSGPELTVMTRPELLSGETLAKFAKLNIKNIQIGLQTINPNISHLITRSAKFETEKIFRQIANEANKHSIGLLIDLIFGLPGDDLAYFQKTLDFAVSLKPWRLQIKQVYLNPNTLFEVYSEKYGIRSGLALPNNVPFVASSQNWSPASLKKAYEYAEAVRKEHPKIGYKIYSEYGFHYDS